MNYTSIDLFAAPRRRPAPAARAWLAALAVVVLTGCGQEPKATFDPPPPPKVEGETVRFETNAPQLAWIRAEPVRARTEAIAHLTGRLYWDADVTVGVFTPVAGRVTRLLADLGQTVAKGTPLAELDSPDLAQALANARTAVGNLSAADKAYERAKELLDHGAAAQKDVEAAEAAYVAALAERDRAESVLANYGGNDQSANSLYLLRSPIAGTVVEKNLSPGQELRADLMLANAPNLFAPSFVVSDPTKLWLQLDVPESELGELRAGERLRVAAPAFPGRVFEGVVDRVGEEMDPATRALKARGLVNNPDGLLKAEMYVLADVERDPGADGQAGVEISAKALFMKEDDSFVFIEAGPGAYQRKQVKVGVEKDNKVPVLQGLSAGQKVVVEGALLLQALVEPGS